MTHLRSAALAACLLCVAGAAQAQDFDLSFYLGSQSSPHSTATFDNGMGGGFDFTPGWEGRSFEMPPYYGFRGTWWQQSGWGFGLEMTHAKVYADNETLTGSGFSRLEFTDGLNIITANAMYRWQRDDSRFTPYAGGGLGVSMPHVEVTGNGVNEIGYQITGPAARLFGGVSYEITDQWSVFGEYNGTYSVNDADLGGGASLQTNIITNAINFGVTYSF
jgi:lipid A oxidase